MGRIKVERKKVEGRGIFIDFILFPSCFILVFLTWL